MPDIALDKPKIGDSPFDVADLYRQMSEQIHGAHGWLQIDGSSLGQYNIDDISVETYDKMLKDGHVGATFDALRLAVLSVDWNINFTGKDPVMQNEVVPFLERQLRNVNSHLGGRKGIVPVMWELLTAVGYGYAVSEIVLEPPSAHDDRIGLKKLKVLEPVSISKFKTDRYGNLEGIYQSVFGVQSGLNNVGGQFIEKEKLLLYPYKMEFGNWWGKSDLRRVYSNWFAKQFIFRFWNIAIEKFALPWAKGTVENEADLREMLTKLKKLQKTSVIATTTGQNVDFLKGVVDRSAFLDAIEYHNRAIMTGLLVPQMIIESAETGAFSQSKTQFSLFMLRVKALQKDLEGLMEQLIKLIVDFNYKNVRGEYPTFNFEEPNLQDMVQLANFFNAGISAGYLDVGTDFRWIRERLGLPEALPTAQIGQTQAPPGMEGTPIPGKPKPKMAETDSGQQLFKDPEIDKRTLQDVQKQLKGIQKQLKRLPASESF